MDKITYLEVNEKTELMKFLIAHLIGKGRNSIKSLLARGQVSLNNSVITKFDYPLEKGQQVVINWTKDESQLEGLKILFEDPYLIVIDKEAGLLSVSSDKEKEITAYSILNEHIKKKDIRKRIFVVHRLDRDTSGVMMFAKSKEIQQSLQNAWQDVVVERSYVVVVEGRVKKEQDTISSWLKQSKALIMYSSHIPEDGQKAITHYRVIKRNTNYSLLEVHLETGRKNQIRVHMHDIGHNIIGDKKYGATKNPLKRLGLHARVLAFKHPVTGEQKRFETLTPKEFLSLFTLSKS